MPSIAFITEPKPTRLDAEETEILSLLGKENIRARYVPWTAPLATLKEHDLLIVKTAYNYYRSLSEFRSFLNQAEDAHIPMQNSPAIVRWNMEKTYLKELEAKGFLPTPTVWIPELSTLNLPEEMEKRGWKKVVLKPTISAGSFNTWVTTPKDFIDIAEDFSLANQTQRYMMQRFLPETVKEGEWSLVFLDGELSHTILKKPREGDFRVQKQYGGQYAEKTPPAEMKDFAERLIQSVPETPLYGRVDGILSGGQFLLMELELIEPDLYLNICPEAGERYIRALKAAL